MAQPPTNEAGQSGSPPVGSPWPPLRRSVLRSRRRSISSPELALEPLVRGLVVARAGKPVRKVLLLDVGAGIIVRVPVADPDSVPLHPRDRRVPQMQGHGQRGERLRVGPRREVRRPARFDLGAAARNAVACASAYCASGSPT